ncbi:DNA double-strand break repair nuclease NurA [Candidatus Micrarchaeota archaeon]|nr:DNA double-strand break repair nuclease NurA [Candidatus Micrarchaeota archaeon]
MDASKLAARISELDRQRRERAEKLRPMLALQAHAAPVTATVAAVDGGLLHDELHGLNVTLVRAMAAVMRFNAGRLEMTSYFPESNVEPKLFWDFHDAEMEEFRNKHSLYRILEEVSLGVRVLEQVRPKFLLMHGSLVPQYVDKPREGSTSYLLYQQVVSEYEKLFRLSQSLDCPVLGIVEDSRGTRVSRECSDSCPDTVLLSYVLREQECTPDFSYAQNPQEHPVLKTFRPGDASKLRLFYVCTAARDRPVRVEYYDYGLNSRGLAGLVLGLCGFSKDYGMPSPIVEADLAARLDHGWLASLKAELSATQTDLLMEKRRNRRPF